MSNHEKKDRPSLPQHPGWIEISIELHPDGHEAVSSFLFDLGCEGIESGSPRNNSLKAFLSFQENLEQVRLSIERFLQELTIIFSYITTYGFSIRIIENRDWNTEWRKFFKPERVTRNLIITPEWEPVPETMDGHVIRIDPGPAFGTGKHSTTRMCLAAMEEVRFPKSWNMLDVGTGSGILAVYGIMLGASEVTAVDIDPEALRWARWNINLNKLPRKIFLTSEKVDYIEGSFFLITANIILGTIIKLLPILVKKLIPEGYLILSGLLSGEVMKVEGDLIRYGLKIEKIFRDEEWACMLVGK
ncbi:MAG: 50S ribosomal protein L11 methyltransferase [Deltaproteobacteria bacterium]|nr:50S ribosomal protein L11 methyltransferase [Deltaproteobacteria bacterium]